MKYIVVFLIVLLFASDSDAQWKKIADFNQELITNVYFLDLPGPPRIGFVGGSVLHKTTDGGATWRTVWGGGITDICFKDSLTGWFTTLGGGAYITVDGGETWLSINRNDGNSSVCEGIYYSDSSRRLFLICDTLIRVSTDLGNTWSDSLPYYAVFSFAFSTPLDGILPVAFYPDTTEGYIITSDGGVSWDTVHVNYGIGGDLLAIAGTHTCFGLAGYGNRVYRSDDLGHTWRQVADIPDSLDFYNGVIQGDFSRLYIQNDSGMLVSLDSGKTWISDGGPGYLYAVAFDHFYAAKGVTFAGSTLSGTGAWEGGGLWEEIWPQSGVEQSSPITSQALLSAQLLENPMKDEIDISYEMGRTALVTMELRDVLGRAVPIANAKYQLEQPGSHTASIPAPNLPPGVYYLRVTTDVGDAITLKLVKQ